MLRIGPDPGKLRKPRACDIASHQPLSRGTNTAMRFPALDGLRALAAFFVVVSHFSNETQIWGGLLGTGGGQLGVMIFFLISGFLMARLYMDGPWNAAEVGAFLQKRVARVVPLYLV